MSAKQGSYRSKSYIFVLNRIKYFVFRYIIRIFTYQIVSPIMLTQIHTFSFAPNWMQMTNEISQIDRFDATWTAIEKKEGQTLKELRSIATVHSVGASTRIEGSRMTDDEVKVLINNLAISKLEERDQQEVAGYFETLEFISESFRDIEITESNIRHLHNMMLKRSKKDSWHKGNYKQLSNTVEAENPDGTKQVIFQTPAPGFATEDAMGKLIEWYKSDIQTHAIIKAAVFVYEFLSIHPFQDGNGRLSRLLGTLLLLKQGYSWVQYVSFEHEIENRKSEYYNVLMQCQQQRPGEEINAWVMFFLECLKNIQSQLITKLQVHTKAESFTQREKKIYSFVENHPGSKSGEIATKLDIPLPTVKRTLSTMVKSKLLMIHGIGAATSYSIDGNASIKKDLAMLFTNAEKKKEFAIVNQGSFLDIKKIILTPLFNWTHPNEWATRLFKSALYIQITCTNNKGIIIKQSYTISSYNSPDYFQPVFSLSSPIKIPVSLWEKTPYKIEYPIQITIELISATPDIDFDVMLIYDEA